MKAPTLSGKQEKDTIFLIRYKAMVECSGLGDVIELGVTIMSGINFAAQADKLQDNCKLFMANRKPWALFVLGHESPHGLAMFRDTISARNSDGKVGDTLARMGEKF